MGYLVNPYLSFGGGVPAADALAQWIAARLEVGYSDTDTMATLVDQSGNGNDFVQATEANKPEFATGVLNSQPGIFFPGAARNAWATCASFFGGWTDAERFMVVKIPSINDGFAGAWKVDATTQASHMFFIGTAYEAFGSDNNRFSLTVTEAQVKTGIIYHSIKDSSGTPQRCYRDGNNSIGTGNGTFGLPSTQITIGASSTNADGTGQSHYFHGWILEWRLYNRNLTDDERNDTLDDLSSIYGISVTHF